MPHPVPRAGQTQTHTHRPTGNGACSPGAPTPTRGLARGLWTCTLACGACLEAHTRAGTCSQRPLDRFSCDRCPRTWGSRDKSPDAPCGLQAHHGALAVCTLDPADTTSARAVAHALTCSPRWAVERPSTRPRPARDPCECEHTCEPACPASRIEPAPLPERRGKGTPGGSPRAK